MLELPDDMYRQSVKLLQLVQMSSGEKSRRHPFVIEKRFRDEGPRRPEDAASLRKALEKSFSPTDFSRTDTGNGLKARAEVATWSNTLQRWDPIYPGECRILIYPGRVDVRDPDNPNGDHVPLLSFALHEGTTKIRHETTTQLVISGTTRHQSVFEDSGDILFRSLNAEELAKLYEMLLEAVAGSPGPIEIPGVPRSDSLGSDSHVAPPSKINLEETQGAGHSNASVKFSRRLSHLRESISTDELHKSNSSPLQDRLQALTAATARFQSTPRQEERQRASDDESAENGSSAGVSRSALAHQVLAYLVDDLKYRPGSYVGCHIHDIARGTKRNAAEVLVAVNELAEQQLIHNTTNGETWVVSRPPAELPVLVRRNTAENIAADLSETAADDQPSLSSTGDRVLSYLRYRSSLPAGHHSQTIRELASALQLHTSIVWPAIRELDTRGIIEQAPDGEAWKLVSDQKIGGQSRSSADAILPALPPSPMRQRAATVSQDISAINMDDYFKVFTPSSDSTAQWTSIDKRLVDPHVLTEAGETLTAGDMYSVVVERAVTAEEVRIWAQRTRQIRLLENLEATSKLASHDNLDSIGPDMTIQNEPVQDTEIGFRYIKSSDGETWTQLNKDLISLQVLTAAGEAAHESQSSIIIHREVLANELRPWVDASSSNKYASAGELSEDDFGPLVSPSGDRWTRISKQLVNLKTLLDSGESTLR